MELGIGYKITIYTIVFILLGSSCMCWLSEIPYSKLFSVLNLIIGILFIAGMKGEKR